MANIRMAGAACAGLIAFASATGANAQAGPTAAAASTVWQLRSGLNVAALACRGEGEGAIVAGYNRMLADHRSELATVYDQVSHQYGSAAAFDSAMTRLYNTYAQPAAQAALCANAQDVLDRLAAQGSRPLGEVADTALAQLQDQAGPRVMTQVAVAAIPQVVMAPPVPARLSRWRERAERWREARWAEEQRWAESQRDGYGARDAYPDDRDPRGADQGDEDGPGDE